MRIQSVFVDPLSAIKVVIINNDTFSRFMSLAIFVMVTFLSIPNQDALRQIIFLYNAKLAFFFLSLCRFAVFLFLSRILFLTLSLIN